MATGIRNGPPGILWEQAEMSGLSQLLQTGLTGLSAATEAMQTVANNTANVSTPGYNVQSVNQTELPGVDGGPGTGTDVTSIQRAFDPFLVSARGAGHFGQPGGAGRADQHAKSRCDLSRRLGRRRRSRIGARQLFLGGEPGRPGSDELQRTARLFWGRAQSLAAAFRSVGGQISASFGSIDSQTTAAVQQIKT